jgi:hypothetical protein
MHKCTRTMPMAVACILAGPAIASDFDGTKSLICATVEARDCVLEADCFTGEAKQVGAPAFFRLDFEKNVIYGPERESPIKMKEDSPAGILLQGSEIGYGLSIGINKQTGNFSASMTNFEGSFLLFGNCTPL